MLSAGGKNTEDIIERLTLLNESFEKLQKAYTPDELERPVYKGDVEIYPVDENGNRILEIGVKKYNPDDENEH